MCDMIKQTLLDGDILTKETKANLLNNISTFGLQRTTQPIKDSFLQLLQTVDLQQLQPGHNNQTFYLRAFSQLLQILFSNAFYQQQINPQGMQQTEFQYKSRQNEIIARRYALLTWGQFYISSKVNKQSLEYRVAINLLLHNNEIAAQLLSEAKQQKLAFKILSNTQFNENSLVEKIYKGCMEGKIDQFINHFKNVSQLEILLCYIAQNQTIKQSVDQYDKICLKDVPQFTPFIKAIRFYAYQSYIKQNNIHQILSDNATTNLLINRFFSELFTEQQTKQIYLRGVELNPFLLNCIQNIELTDVEQQMILRIALKTNQLLGQQQNQVDVYRGIKKEIQELEKEQIVEYFNCLNYMQ